MRKNLLLASLALTFAFAACEKKPAEEIPQQATGDTAVVQRDEPNPVTDPATYDWSNIDLNVPDVTFPEITSKGITLRGNDRYTVYSLGDNILFASGKADINKAAEADLKQVAESIKQRYNGGWIRLYGFTDAAASDSANKMLSQQRADAVKNWLVTNGGFDMNRISVNAMGESNPVATNTTPKGREQNRRVEIVATK
jgi:outer membrane protein OmpA-like peptidoglycan-associated protein